MTTLQFPSNPNIGDEYDYPPYKYYWDGQKWKTKGIGYNPVNDLRNEVLPTTREAIRRSYAEAGYTLVDGSFEDGGVLTNASDVLLRKANGKVYSWGGTLPKDVIAESSPIPEGSSAWVDRTDKELRSEMLTSVLRMRSGQLALRDSISVADFGAIPDYDIATKTIGFDSSAAFNAAMSAARLVNADIVIPPAPDGKAYYISETMYPHYYSGVGTNPGGYLGPRWIGLGKRGAWIVFDLDEDQVGLHLFGTSGFPSTLGYKNLTIRPHTAGKGIGVCEQGPCVMDAENCDIQDFKVNLKLSNGVSAGIFTEFGTHRRLWLKNATVADLQFRQDGGDSSFHGSNFENIIINTKTGAVGVDIGAGCNVYNASWHMNLFAETGAKFILNNGLRTGDDRMYFEGTASVENNGSWITAGNWRVENATGQLADTSTKPFYVSSYISPQTPTDGGLIGLGVSTIEATKPLGDGSYGNDLVRLRGNNVEAIAYAGYGGGAATSQGIGMCEYSFGSSLKNIILRSFWSLAGFTSFIPKFTFKYNGQTGDQLAINSSGYHSGQMGRAQTQSISANGGLQQTVSIGGVLLPAAGKPTIVSLVLSAPGAAHNTAYTYICTSNPYGGESNAALIATNNLVVSGSFQAPSNVKINSSGLFQFTLTTSIALTADVNIVGIGVY